MSTPALCQCVRCLRYLAENRLDDNTFINNYCEECTRGGLKLAKIRGTLSHAASLELLALLAEECAETTQRIGKIIRWGWDADFEGSTQREKLESELGDIVAAMNLADFNGMISWEKVLGHARAKMFKFQEDAKGPRQRLLVAKVPPEAE